MNEEDWKKALYKISYLDFVEVVNNHKYNVIF